MKPRVELAREAGVQIGKTGGIKVNRHMMTTAPDIYACGDCVETGDIITGESTLNLFWLNANQQGSVVGFNCAGKPVQYPGSQNLLNVDVFGHHVVGFGYTEATYQKTIGKDDHPSNLSVIDTEKNTRYCRLVILGDRCVGAQFINPDKDPGLIWSLILKRRSISGILKMLESKEMMVRRPWLNRVKPFLKG